MKFLNYEFLTIGEENEFENIYLFKKVAISPKNKDFLRSKITIKNYCIMSIQSGQFEWKLDGETFKIRPNDLILVSPGVEMEKDFENVEFVKFGANTCICSFFVILSLLQNMDAEKVYCIV